MGRTARAAFGVAGVAALLRIVWVATIARPPKGLGDPILYLLFAKGIASGRGYVSAGGDPTAYYPPGYPYFLGSVNWILERLGAAAHMVPVTLVLQALMGAATAGMVVVVASRVAAPLLGADRALRTGVIAGSLMAVWPNLIAQTGLVLSEPLFLFLFVGLLMAITRVLDDHGGGSAGDPPPGRLRHVSIAAVMFAACVVVRPQSTLFVLPILVVVLMLCRWDRRDVARVGGAFVVALALVLVPWTIRNAVRLHAFVPLTTNTGDNLCLGFNPDANGGFLYNEYCITDAMYLEGTQAEVRQNKEKTAKAFRWAIDNPTALPRLSVAKVWITMENDVDALWGLQSFGHDVFIPDRTFANMKAGANLFYRSLLLLAAVGTAFSLTRLRRSPAGHPLLWVVLALIPAALVVPILSFGDPRFKAPLVPSLAILAALAIDVLVERASRLRQRPGAASDTAAQAASDGSVMMASFSARTTGGPTTLS